MAFVKLSFNCLHKVFEKLSNHRLILMMKTSLVFNVALESFNWFVLCDN